MRKYFLAALILLLPKIVFAETISSGLYDEIMIGFNPVTKHVSGYMYSSTGGGHFSCIFYISGKLKGKSAKIISYFPGDLGKPNINIVPGNADFENETELALTLKDEPGGCWNVIATPKRNADDSVEYTFSKDYKQFSDWHEIGVVKAKKAYFYNAPDGAKRITYLVTGDGVGILNKKSDWLEVEYSRAAKPIKGWMKSKDFYNLRQ